MELTALRNAGRALVLLSASMLSSGCRECPRIHQQVTISEPDESLVPLLDACRAGQPAPGETCAGPPSAPAGIQCGCLSLCRRVLEIIDQFPGAEALEECQLLPLPDAGTTGGQVIVTYRPSTCS